MIWSALFTVGNFLYGRMGYALPASPSSRSAGLVLLRVVTRLAEAKAPADGSPIESVA